MFGGNKHTQWEGDVEAGIDDTPLYPAISELDNQLRWQFVRKVYGIVGFQLLLTTIVSLIIILNPPLHNYLSQSLPIQLSLFLLSILFLLPLYHYRQRHPHNLIFLSLWTAIFSVTIGLACTFYQPVVVIQAVAVTAGIIGGLTLYTFRATSIGVEFTWMAPMLYGALWGMLLWGIIQLFFPPSHLVNSIYSLLGALLFSFYIVFDTHLLIKHMPPDEYIWAATQLYLDCVNLFMYILSLLGNNRRE